MTIDRHYYIWNRCTPYKINLMENGKRIKPLEVYSEPFFSLDDNLELHQKFLPLLQERIFL